MRPDLLRPARGVWLGLPSFRRVSITRHFDTPVARAYSSEPARSRRMMSRATRQPRALSLRERTMPERFSRVRSMTRKSVPFLLCAPLRHEGKHLIQIDCETRSERVVAVKAQELVVAASAAYGISRSLDEPFEYHSRIVVEILEIAQIEDDALGQTVQLQNAEYFQQLPNRASGGRRSYFFLDTAEHLDSAEEFGNPLEQSLHPSFGAERSLEETRHARRITAAHRVKQLGPLRAFQTHGAQNGSAEMRRD